MKQEVNFSEDYFGTQILASCQNANSTKISQTLLSRKRLYSKLEHAATSVVGRAANRRIEQNQITRAVVVSALFGNSCQWVLLPSPYRGAGVSVCPLCI